MQFLWGRPRRRGELRFDVWYQTRDVRHHSDVVHPLLRHYGIAIGDKVFIGIMLFDERMQDRYEVEVPSGSLPADPA